MGSDIRLEKEGLWQRKVSGRGGASLLNGKMFASPYNVIKLSCFEHAHLTAHQQPAARRIQRPRGAGRSI